MDAGERESTKEPGKRPREAMDDERPRRPWLLIIASLLLAVIAAWTGVQWKQARDQEGKLRGEEKQGYPQPARAPKKPPPPHQARHATQALIPPPHPALSPVGRGESHIIPLPHRGRG